MSFIKKQAVTTQTTVNVPVLPGKESNSIHNLQTLLANITADELEVLAKVALKPTVKAMAISKAKLFV